MTDEEVARLRAVILEARNGALELAAQYFSALGPNRKFTTIQIAAAIRSLKIDKWPA